MNAFLIFASGVAGLWALARIIGTARRVARANRLRTQELLLAAGAAATPERGSDYLEAVRQADTAAAQALREDYTLTGAVLAALGAAAMFTGRSVAYGDWAVGLYTAGTIGILCGVALAVLGSVLRVLARPLLDPTTTPRSDH